VEEEQKKAEKLKDEATAAAIVAEEAADVAQEAAAEAVVEAAAEPAAEQLTEEAVNVSSSATAAAQDATAAASTVRSAASAAAPSPFDIPQRAQATSFPPRETQPSSFANPSPTPIIYVGNLFFEVTVAQLEQEFGRYGRVINSRIVTDARGLSKGFGYIEFESQDAADRAVRELDQKVFQGRRMAVQYHVRREPRSRMQQGGIARQPNQPSKTLFIGNMSYQMSDRDLNGNTDHYTISI
jgi:nucleolin